ncbi:hypothetical protein WICMUC_000883 [Wickerhamomyces mucosus]|uniref:calcium/calmodulin-dependent protein kinase n=1 Tax=Wickerhamomyces mucosus TaxID=1378264 RepID=A0A9P8TI66_9ASCO|nr:hypothetical protein WICMUC_000883 [Wickerhamomyces mucosus]
MPIVGPDSTVDTSGNKISKFFNKLTGQPDSYAKKSNYIYGRTLGAGAMGVVRQARNINNKEDVAIKIILKKTFKGNEQQLYDELSLLEKCNHRNIIKFKDWFESKDKFYIVTQLATGGELFDRIVSKGKFLEKDVISIVKQLLGALNYLHNELNIVHRDLKPENLLYVTSDENSELVLADFGIAKELRSSDEVLFSAAGSLGYCAPEVLLGTGHGKPCDIWSLGVITYTLLVGYSPFRADNVTDFLQECETEPVVTFHRDYWKDISKDATEFILKCLKLDQFQRSRAEDLLKDKWLNNDEEQYSENDLLPTIKKFNSKKKFIQAVEIIKLKNRIKKLRELQNINDDDEDFEYYSGSSVSGSVDSIDLNTLSIGAHNDHNKDNELKSNLNANLFQQIVRAATENREKVLNFKEESGSSD